MRAAWVLGAPSWAGGASLLPPPAPTPGSHQGRGQSQAPARQPAQKAQRLPATWRTEITLLKSSSCFQPISTPFNSIPLLLTPAGWSSRVTLYVPHLGREHAAASLILGSSSSGPPPGFLSPSHLCGTCLQCSRLSLCAFSSHFLPFLKVLGLFKIGGPALATSNIFTGQAMPYRLRGPQECF